MRKNELMYDQVDMGMGVIGDEADQTPWINVGTMTSHKKRPSKRRVRYFVKKRGFDPKVYHVKLVPQGKKTVKLYAFAVNIIPKSQLSGWGAPPLKEMIMGRRMNRDHQAVDVVPDAWYNDNDVYGVITDREVERMYGLSDIGAGAGSSGTPASGLISDADFMPPTTLIPGYKGAWGVTREPFPYDTGMGTIDPSAFKFEMRKQKRMLKQGIIKRSAYRRAKKRLKKALNLGYITDPAYKEAKMRGKAMMLGMTQEQYDSYRKRTRRDYEAKMKRGALDFKKQEQRRKKTLKENLKRKKRERKKPPRHEGEVLGVDSSTAKARFRRLKPRLDTMHPNMIHRIGKGEKHVPVAVVQRRIMGFAWKDVRTFYPIRKRIIMAFIGNLKRKYPETKFRVKKTMKRPYVVLHLPKRPPKRRRPPGPPTK